MRMRPVDSGYYCLEFLARRRSRAWPISRTVFAKKNTISTENTTAGIRNRFVRGVRCAARRTCFVVVAILIARYTGTADVRWRSAPVRHSAALPIFFRRSPRQYTFPTGRLPRGRPWNFGGGTGTSYNLSFTVRRPPPSYLLSVFRVPGAGRSRSSTQNNYPSSGRPTRRPRQILLLPLYFSTTAAARLCGMGKTRARIRTTVIVVIVSGGPGLRGKRYYL